MPEPIEQDINYEVEEILDSRTDPETNELAYLVKWLNYPHFMNTWELEDDINSPESIAQYNKKASKQNKAKKARVEPNFAAEILQYLMGIVGPPLCMTPRKMLKLLKKMRIKFDATQLDSPDHQTDIEIFSAQLEDLPSYNELWEDYINAQYWDISDEPRISIENRYDDELFPSNFHFITESLISDIILVENMTEPVGCNCTDGRTRHSCMSSTNCCQTLMTQDVCDVIFAYDSRMRLVPGIEPGTPIYECNEKCSCSEECSNR